MTVWRCCKVIMLIRKRKDSVELEKVLIEASDWAVNRQMKFSADK